MRSKKIVAPKGYILHEDSERVIIATMESENGKTGDMVQVWILCRNVNPVEAVRTGMDRLICGDCKLGPGRPNADGFKERPCYVLVWNAPLSVFESYENGNYPYLPESRYAEVFGDRAVRFGAYGDPIHIPIGIVRAITEVCVRWTGYTHQWRNAAYQAYRSFLMASADNAVERTQANLMGWRTFRVRPEGAPIEAGEVTCPASKEAGFKSQCIRCGLCNGSKGAADPRKDITLLVHGAGAKSFVALESITAARA